MHSMRLSDLSDCPSHTQFPLEDDTGVYRNVGYFYLYGVELKPLFLKSFFR